MAITAVICEYNPFHNGHAYHLRRTRELTGTKILTLMSGHFVQRGETALLPTEIRAEHAILGGADLVLTLPVAYAIGRAERFAAGAIRMLDGIPDVKYLSFGIESGTLNELERLAELLLDEPPELSDLVKKRLAVGMSYPRAHAEAARECFGSLGELLDRPNNTLAIEYLKALKRANSTIEPVAIPRIGDGYAAIMPTSTVASATAIRNLHMHGTPIEAFVPPYAADTLRTVPPASNERFYAFCREKLLAPNAAEALGHMADCGEGLGYRLIAAAETNAFFSDFIAAVKTKRYTRARINRILTSLLLDLSDEIAAAILYAPQIYRVPAYADADVLKSIPDPILRIKDTNELSPSQTLALAAELRADRYYRLVKGLCYDRNAYFRTRKLTRD